MVLYILYTVLAYLSRNVQYFHKRCKETAKFMSLSFFFNLFFKLEIHLGKFHGDILYRLRFCINLQRVL
jgi:hypothetical protein